MTPATTNPQPSELDTELDQLRRALQHLIDTGMEIARIIRAKVDAEGITPASALAFQRVARAIHRTILLLEKLKNPGTVLDTTEVAAARLQVANDLKEALQHQARIAPQPAADKPDTPEQDHSGTQPRTDDHVRAESIGNQPIADVVASICRNLSLAARSPTPRKRRPTPREPSPQPTSRQEPTPRPNSPNHPTPNPKRTHHPPKKLKRRRKR